MDEIKIINVAEGVVIKEEIQSPLEDTQVEPEALMHAEVKTEDSVDLNSLESAESDRASSKAATQSPTPSPSSLPKPISPRPKRQRLGNESLERFEKLCGIIERIIAAKVEKSKCKNSAFLQMLDECLQKKPEDVQDRLKIELLTYVHNAN